MLSCSAINFAPIAKSGISRGCWSFKWVSVHEMLFLTFSFMNKVSKQEEKENKRKWILLATSITFNCRWTTIKKLHQKSEEKKTKYTKFENEKYSNNVNHRN